MRAGRSAGCCIGLLAVVAACATVSAANVATNLDRTPIPRVESGGHSGSIKKLAVDRLGRYLLTVADDKTARVWDARTGRLLHVLRVPIGAGHEGQLYAAALSPDGRIAAVGGVTGLADRARAMVYFFDVESGRMVLRLLDLSDAAVENLAFSDDAKVLAVCLSDGRGVRIFDWQQGRLLRSYDDTIEKILGVDFAPNGDLAMTTLDGKLWVFGAKANFDSKVVPLQGGRLPMHVQFSPDGSEMAVGFDVDPTFSIVGAANLQEVHRVTLPAAAGQRGLHVVEWSEDGEYIYAGGETVAGFDAPLYRFSQHGRGAAQLLIRSTKRISDARRLPNGALAFASFEPEVGVIETTGRTRWRFRSPTMDLRRMAADFRMSSSGSSVAFGAADGRSGFAFDVRAVPESALKVVERAPQSPQADPKPPAGWMVSVGEDRESLIVNGNNVPLDNGEAVLTWTFSSDARFVVIGTRWSLRLVDRAGNQQWAAPLAAEVVLAKVTDDGKSIVAALSDGTLRWHRRGDGKEFMALFAHRNGQDWICWIPLGYYMSSLSGDNFIGWHVNRGADGDPDFYRAIQFERVLYRPDIVRRYFEAQGLGAPGALTADDAFEIAQLDTVAPPRLQLSSKQFTAPDGRQMVTVQVAGESKSLPMQEWSLYLNGIPMTPAADRRLAASEATAFKRETTLSLTARTSQLRAESNNGRSLGIAEMQVEAAAATAASAGDLYVVAVGASEFVDPELTDLKFASRDAVEFANAFAAEFKRDFRDVKTIVLSDTEGERATRENLERLAPFIAPATGSDTVILFLASHGISDPKGNYFFVPADGRLQDIKAVQNGGTVAPSLVRWDFFVDLMRTAAGRRLLIVDTCSSGALGSTFDVHSLAKRSMSSNFALMAASKGAEQSQEFPAQRHGLFTYGLLQGLRSGFDPDRNGYVSLSEAFEFAFDQVQSFRNRAVGEQTPQLSAPDALADMPLVSVSKRTAANCCPL